MMKSAAFAPVNIALIKYMGKTKTGKPSNSSFSMTLDDLGTHTQIEVLQNSNFDSRVNWDPSGYVPPQSGQEKVERFLFRKEIWQEALNDLDYEAQFPETSIQILSHNTIPAGTGIASSASAFAALTLAWSGVLVGKRIKEWQNDYLTQTKHRQRLAQVAGLGSGSACRSLSGPWVEWDAETGLVNTAEWECPWVDLILLIEQEPKVVSSSEAHQRVQTSPLFSTRLSKTQERMSFLKNNLNHPLQNLEAIQATVLDEALEMHELFHTSQPSFSYLEPLSQEWIQLVQERSSKLPRQNILLTLDAGANVHLLVLKTELELWRDYLKQQYPQLKALEGFPGTGARYE